MSKVLYLDDEETLTKLIPQILETKGFEVTPTEDINDALKKFNTEDFDVVLLDIMMEPTDDMDAEKLDYGRKTGIEVARIMKENKPKIPIIAFSITTDERIIGEIHKFVTDVVTKPIEITQLINALQKAIKK